jgi:recombinational DNA repair protein RecR
MKNSEIKQRIADTGENIADEMKNCENCPDHLGDDICHCCGTFGNIRDYEMQLAALNEELENSTEGVSIRNKYSAKR